MLAGLRVVDDVPHAFAEIVATEVRATSPTREGRAFRLAASGGSSGSACFEALAVRSDLDFSDVELFFADERCVDTSSPDSNQWAIATALGSRRPLLAGFHPMVCEHGASAYESELRAAGGLDLVQLGLGPDGHTASLFPGSKGLDADATRLVVPNVDPTGRNPLERLTLTYAGIALAPVVVLTVIGGARAKVLAAIANGADYPASKVESAEVIWLVDEAAAQLLRRNDD